MATIPNPAKSRTWDLGTSANGTFFDTEFNQLYANDNNLDTRVQSLEANPVVKYAKLSDVKASNTAAGGATTGSFITRTLNTEDIDADNIVSLASDQFTLGSGTYEIRASAPGYRVDRHKAVLYNVTDSANTIIGTSENCSNQDDVQTRSLVSGRFTISGTKVFEIRQRFQTGQATNGLGLENGFGVSEVYTVVELWKVA